MFGSIGPSLTMWPLMLKFTYSSPALMLVKAILDVELEIVPQVKGAVEVVLVEREAGADDADLLDLRRGETLRARRPGG